MFDALVPAFPVQVKLYTDSYVARGVVRTRQRRLSDLLNQTEHHFLVLEDVVLDEFGSRQIMDRATFAQINLDTVLFGVAEADVEPLPELRTPKIPEQALIIVPPFRITGRIHLMPERDLRTGLDELLGKFLPVTDATFWSERLNEPRTRAPMLAVNHARAHIFAPHVERDVWAGLPAGEAAASGSEGETPASGEAAPVDPTTAGAADPWRDLPR